MKAIVYSPETAAALEGSIEKWRSIRDGVGEDEGSVNCPLCTRFMHGDDYCARNGEKCPVYAKTGSASCFDSPYYEWRYAAITQAYAARPLAELPPALKATTPELVALAQAELDFLESLKWEERSLIRRFSCGRARR